VDAPRLEVAADAAGLDVDDRAGAQLNCIGRGLRGSDRLVKADRCANHLGQLSMREHLLFRQRLLDEQELEGIQLGEVLCMPDRVGGVGVDLQRHIPKALAHRPYRLHVPPRFDLELDAPVALIEVLANSLQQLRDRAVDADGDSTIDLGPNGSEVLSKRRSAGPGAGGQAPPSR